MLRNVFSCFQSLTVKQWPLPFFAFVTTFTVVMTILVLSTDFHGRRFIHFNSTVLWEFEEHAQESPVLAKIIQHNYIHPPQLNVKSKYSIKQKPSSAALKYLRSKTGGVFMECGAGLESDTFWIEKFWNWKGLLTQPYPEEYARLIAVGRKRSHTAQVCISPTIFPRHALFKNSSSSTNETLTAVPCFPLFSLMKAFNATTLDLLILNDVKAHIQVLKTLPLKKIRISTISFVLRESEDGFEGDDDPCCSDTVTELLESWGYKRITPCPTSGTNCYFVCKSKICPFSKESFIKN